MEFQVLPTNISMVDELEQICNEIRHKDPIRIDYIRKIVQKPDTYIGRLTENGILVGFVLFKFYDSTSVQRFLICGNKKGRFINTEFEYWLRKNKSNITTITGISVKEKNVFKFHVSEGYKPIEEPKNNASNKVHIKRIIGEALPTNAEVNRIVEKYAPTLVWKTEITSQARAEADRVAAARARTEQREAALARAALAGGGGGGATGATGATGVEGWGGEERARKRKTRRRKHRTRKH